MSKCITEIIILKISLIHYVAYASINDVFAHIFRSHNTSYMKEIIITDYLDSEHISLLIEEIPTKILFFLNNNIQRSRVFIEEKIAKIIIAGQDKIDEAVIMHELLHIKARFAGYYNIGFLKEISDNIKMRIGNVHSTYEHINFVYPEMLKYGLNPYNENQTKLLIEVFKSKSIDEMTLSNFFFELISCSYFETEKKEHRSFIVSLINKFPPDFSELLAFFIVKLNESLLCTSIKDKNEKLKEMILFIEKIFNISDCINLYTF